MPFCVETRCFDQIWHILIFKHDHLTNFEYFERKPGFSSDLFWHVTGNKHIFLRPNSKVLSLLTRHPLPPDHTVPGPSYNVAQQEWGQKPVTFGVKWEDPNWRNKSGPGTIQARILLTYIYFTDSFFTITRKENHKKSCVNNRKQT